MRGRGRGVSMGGSPMRTVRRRRRVVRGIAVAGAMGGRRAGRRRRRGGVLMPIIVILIIMALATGGLSWFVGGIIQWLPLIGIVAIIGLLVRRRRTNEHDESEYYDDADDSK